MEIAIWTFVVFVLVALFKTLKYEKNIAVYNERQLLMRYLEIKNINPDYRISYLSDWEKHVIAVLEERANSKASRVINLKSFNNIK